MIGFRLAAQKPPEAKRITDDVIQRFDHIYEVDPAKMTIIEQQEMPAWDTLRIVDSRWEHLAWMHDHWADSVLTAEQLGEGGPHPDGPPLTDATRGRRTAGGLAANTDFSIGNSY